jgi:acyl-CoA thioesterase-1
MSVVRWLCILFLVSIAPGALAAPVILVLGDSLSAAFGIGEQQGWVSLLRDKLEQNGYPHAVVNASVSGDTTRDALSRLDDTLARHRPDIVIVELGGNDGLRALPLAQVRANLEAMLSQIETAGARALLLGIRIPLNYGAEYAEQFHAMYADLAKQHHAGLVDFFMERVALNANLMQEDGIHPNTAAQPVLLDTLWPALQPLLSQSSGAKPE